MSNGRIVTRKNSYNLGNFSVVPSPVIKNVEDDEKDHYYGMIKNISSNNDISFISRGSVYYLRDNIRDPNTSYHPYLVIQSAYLDKIGKISVFGITSQPANINMIPIVMGGSLAYINPHQPFVYSVDEFYETGTRFIGSVVNTEVLDLACNLYGLYLGMNLVKSKEEIETDYINYVSKFNARAKDVKQYKHRVLDDNKQQLEFKYSFVVKNTPVDDDTDDENNETCSERMDYEENDDTQEIINNDTKVEIVVDLTSQAILTAVGMVNDNRNVTLGRDVSELTMDEIKLFMACIKTYGYIETSKIYGCSHGTVSNRRRSILDTYDVKYIN